jgi:hypothetical protein
VNFEMSTPENLISRLQNWFRSLLSNTEAATSSGVANRLMERSRARGVSPRQAEELRLAACAYLSVVR